MDLFPVNRFMGEEKENEEEESVNVANELLQRLNVQAERKRKKNTKRKSRKLMKMEEVKEINEDRNVDNGLENKDNESKNENRNVDNGLENKNNESKDIGENQVNDKKKKRKKRKRKKIGSGFTIIHDVRNQQKENVQRELPYWIMNPIVIEGNLSDKVTDVDQVENLEPFLIDRLKSNGIDYLFPVQRAILPLLLKSYWNYLQPPRDYCVSAPTGSGKTLAFVLPIVQTLRKRVVCRVRALCVLPVHNLAVQVYQVFKEYSKDTKLLVRLLGGSTKFGDEQGLLVRQGPRFVLSMADVVVTTPGRLVDHMNNTPGFNLHYLRYLVIDEADRMMDTYQNEWFSHIERSVYSPDSPISRRHWSRPLTVSSMSPRHEPFQKLLFSATLTNDPEKLEKFHLFAPHLYKCINEEPDEYENIEIESKNIKKNDEDSEMIQKKREEDSEKMECEMQGDNDEEGSELLEENVCAADKNMKMLENETGKSVDKVVTPLELEERFVTCEANLKPLVLHHLLVGWKRVIVFTNSKENTHRLTLLLKALGQNNVTEFTSLLRHDERAKRIRQFADGRINVLVSTDAMARGMDVPDVDVVVSYDIAKYINSYVHRVGRTARAGRKGLAVSILLPKQRLYFDKMMSMAGKLDVKEDKVEEGDLVQYEQLYQQALRIVSEKLETERQRKKEKRERAVGLYGKRKNKVTKSSVNLVPLRKRNE